MSKRQNISNTYSIAKRGILLLGLVASALPSVADEFVDEGIIEELVVTAQKRPSRLQDVPFSVAVATAEQIHAAGVGNIAEFSRNVAGLTITDLGHGQSQVAIRGISAGQIARDQPGLKESVGIYLDESSISTALFTPDLDLFDVERMEVLRGPQTTLFGAGSSSGTVRYITRQPKLDRLEGAAEVSAFSGTGSEPGASVKGAINIPMGDVAALRIVGYRNELPGFIDSTYPRRGPTGIHREDVNGGEKYGGRVSLLIQPHEDLSITPRVVHQRLKTDGYPRIDVYNILGNPYTTTEPPVDPGKRGQITQLQEGIDDDFTLADVKVDVGMGGVKLTSISSYTNRDVQVLRDASQLTGSITYEMGGNPSQVRLDSPLYDETDLRTWSEEIRLASDTDDAFQWLAGVFYQHVDRKYGQTLPTPGYDSFLMSIGRAPSMAYGAPADTPYYSRIEYDFDQIAVFGEATYRFTREWSLTGGMRYFDVDEERWLTFAGPFVGAEWVNNQQQYGTTTSDGFSPRVILSFEPSRQMLFTAQVARGFRLGGINDPLNEGICSPQSSDAQIYGDRPTWDDEKVMNYELGTKITSANGRLQVNASAFYSDIDGLQVVADAGSCSSRVVFNAQAESLGAELEILARPADGWDLGLSATYVEAQITESVLGSDGNPVAGIRRGNRLPTSPQVQAAATVGYSWLFPSSLEGFTNFAFQHVGSSYTQLADQESTFGCLGCIGSAAFLPFGAPTIDAFRFDAKLPDYQIGNLRFGIRSDFWETAVFINNLWDEHAKLSLDRERGGSARVGYLTNQPRTYGLAVRVNF